MKNRILHSGTLLLLLLCGCAPTITVNDVTYEALTQEEEQHLVTTARALLVKPGKMVSRDEIRIVQKTEPKLEITYSGDRSGTAEVSWQAPEIRDGIVAAIAIKMQNPVFESQTKNKLGSTEVRTWIVNEVKEAVLEALLKDKAIAQGLQDKVTTNEKVHKEEQEVRNNSKERAKRTAVHIPKLRDCRYHLDSASAQHRKEAENSMIFLTEGDSAAGTLSNIRDSNTQAVFALRGKPFNVQGYKRTELYKHEELYNIMVALGIENGIDDIRYSKVVIATDADTDGFHIRILLMTYFLSYFEELVTSGRLFILETPLFRVRNKAVTEYCYSEVERDQAMGRIRGCEVTRFKGLGEISPNEFKRFIGEDIKLLPVTITSIKDIRDKMEFYMGQNTPQRREFIMENLLDVTG